MKKPVRLEFNNSGAWKVLGRFDAADGHHTDMVLDAASDLVSILHNTEDPKRCPTLLVSIDDSMQQVLMRWSLTTGWRDAVTGEPA